MAEVGAEVSNQVESSPTLGKREFQVASDRPKGWFSEDSRDRSYCFGVERPRPSSHIIARYFDRVRR